MQAQTPDPGCETYLAWTIQSSPRTDTTGMLNHAYPEANATYWITPINAPLGTTVVIKGQFPAARYMALQVYDYNQNLLGAINDMTINPDSGQNNPYRTGTAQGTYTMTLIFGRQPNKPPPNTIYTSNTTKVLLIYRIYYSNNPNDLTGGTWNPVLPVVQVGGANWSACPPRPIITPVTASVWGRLDQTDYSGAIPSNHLSANNPPDWTLSTTNGATPYFPSADNSYMTAYLSREYLMPPSSFDMVVISLRTPTYDNTQAGVPPYTAAQTRFWSMCTDEPVTTSVVRCTPDYLSPAPGGVATYVISDPGKMPSASVLNQWGASWIAWGALYPGDTVYDPNGVPLTNADGVYYYGFMIYRQTLAASSFSQSIANVGKLPGLLQKNAMGPYWPQIGYCHAADFQTLGAACITKKNNRIY